MLTTEMTDADWADENALAIALYLDGSEDDGYHHRVGGHLLRLR